MKLVAINDIHKTSVAPRSRTADYNEQINAKLLEVVSFCNEYSVDFLLITGDFFHSINIENTPYWQCGEAANILIKCKCPIIAALGNHDWDEVPQRLPYFPIFYAYKAAKVYFKPVSGRVDIASKWNDLYEFVVINSNDGSNLDDAWDVVNKLGPTERTRIIVYHGPIVPPSFEYLPNKIHGESYKTAGFERHW